MAMEKVMTMASARSQCSRCLIPGFVGAIHSMEWKDALWDRYVMAAPRPRTPSEQQHSDRKLRTVLAATWHLAAAGHGRRQAQETEVQALPDRLFQHPLPGRRCTHRREGTSPS